MTTGDPLFTDEGPQDYAAAFAHNAPFAVPGPYQTTLSPTEESNFRQWVMSNRIPFDPDASVVDYDMRGFWRDTGGGKWSPGQHFPDTYKTPYDTTFSNESKYATANNPFVWQGDRLIDRRSGQLIFAPPKQGPLQSSPSSFEGGSRSTPVRPVADPSQGIALPGPTRYPTPGIGTRAPFGQAPRQFPTPMIPGSHTPRQPFQDTSYHEPTVDGYAMGRELGRQFAPHFHQYVANAIQYQMMSAVIEKLNGL